MIIQNNWDTVTDFYREVNMDKSLSQTSNDIPTPLECVDEMIQQIPSEFWKRDDIKILDPCCGCGNFFVLVYKKLAEYHSHDYIMKYMLYFNDINQDRLTVIQKVFGDANITKQDFLTYNSTTKFNLIVANPPYAKLLPNGRRASKNHNLIGSFLTKSFDLLIDGGYLLYITPDNWMSLSDRNVIIREITSKQLLYLNIHLAKRYFKKIGSSFTWYLVENTPYYKPMRVEGKWKTITYTDEIPSEVRSYIPQYYTSIVQSILSKTIDADNIKFKVETSSHLHKHTKRHLIQTTADDEHPYRLIHTPKQIVWSSKPHKYQDGYKVFLGLTSVYTIFIDTCGMTQSIAFIRCGTLQQAEHVRSILLHPLYRFINNICRWGNFNNIRILQRFPLCNPTENIYDKFNLTQDEINFIDNLDRH